MAVRRGRRTGRFGMRSILLSPPGPTTGALARGARRTGPPPDRVRVAARSRPGTTAAWAPATLQPVKGRSCAGSECASRRRSPPDKRPRPHSTRSDGPSTPTRRVRRSAGWARVERFGSSDELGQHPRARGFAKRRRRCLSRQSCRGARPPPLPCPADFRSVRCGRQSAHTILPAGAAKIAAASRLQWSERLRLHRPERLQGPRKLYTSGRAQRAERHHHGRNIVTR
jgi:hypothetical protein